MLLVCLGLPVLCPRGPWDELSLWLLPFITLVYLTVWLFTPCSERQLVANRWMMAGYGLDLLFVSLQSPFWLALLWPLTHLPLLARCEDRWTRRLFLVYLGPGCLFFCIGALGHPSSWALYSLLAGIALRKALLPLHQWLPALAERVPLGSLVCFLTPQLGAYAIVRLLAAHAPQQALAWFGVLALATAVYSACLAIGHRSLRAVYASLFIGQSSLVTIGLQCASHSGIAGGLAVWFSSGLALTGWGVCIWALEARRGRLPLDRYHGGYARSPVLASCFLLLGLTCVGFPCSVGFLAQELLLEGTLDTYPHVGVLAALTAFLNGITILRSYFHLFCGSRQEYGYSQSIRHRERVALILLLSLLVGFGAWPDAFFASRDRIASNILQARHLRQP
ncbi:MAG: proton-conducting transporter membrane subunit [Vulcanimicrobiota bacterium]